MLNSRMPESFGLRESRWLILLAFPVAGVPALLLSGSIEPACYLVAAMLACGWLLRRLDTLRPVSMAIWLVLLVFIAFYFLRYPVLLIDPSTVAATHPDSMTPLFLNDREGLTRALRLSTFVFVSFCIVAGFLMRMGCWPARETAIVVPKGNPGNMKWMWLAVLLLMTVLACVAYTYRIGLMGAAPGDPLPFRLKGVVFYARHVLLPILILAMIWRASLSGDRRMLTASLFLLIVHGCSDTLQRGSKSSLLLCLLLVLFLSVSGGRLVRRRGAVILGVLLFGAVLLIPTIGQYRSLRFQSDADSWQLFVQAFSMANGDFWFVLKRSFASLYFRIPGIETAWAIGSLVNEPLGIRLFDTIRSPFGVTGYLNFNVYGVLPEAYTLYAPGAVGWLYLAGGWPGLMAGSGLLAALCVGVPQFLYGGRLRWSPVANTFLLWVLFVSLTDGTLDSNAMLIGAGLVTLAALELFDRAAERDRRA